MVPADQSDEALMAAYVAGDPLAFDRLFARWAPQIRQLYIRAEVVDLRSTSVEVPRDPQDTPILATLVASSADVLVSGDRDLLELRGKYPIQTPAEFVRRL